MTGMIERVARAIHKERFGDNADFDNGQRRLSYHSIREARKAIEAMRVPTPGMLVAGSIAKHPDAGDDQYVFVGSISAEACWPAMIDAALQESK